MKHELRRLIAHMAISDGSPEAAGAAGECFAKHWFAEHSLEYYCIPQSPETMPPALAAYGGKRPDFAVDFKGPDGVVYVDAKFHKTNGVTQFAMTVEEINKYKALQAWDRATSPGQLNDADVIFIVFPKELASDAFVWVHLDEFSRGTATTLDSKPAIAVSLLDRDELWVENRGDA
jgi:hypothetical protein